MVHVSCPGTGRTVHLARHAQSAGADAVVVTGSCHWDLGERGWRGTSTPSPRQSASPSSATRGRRSGCLRVSALAPGDGISGAELTACARAQDVTVGRGDIVLVRTGHLSAARRDGWGDYAGGRRPGAGPVQRAHFLCGREVAAVAVDTCGAEVRPNGAPDILQPLHLVLLVNAGIPQGEMFDLERLAEGCVNDGVYEFFLGSAPPPIAGAVGGPMNPIAVK